MEAPDFSARVDIHYRWKLYDKLFENPALNQREEYRSRELTLNV